MNVRRFDAAHMACRKLVLIGVLDQSELNDKSRNEGIPLNNLLMAAI